MAITPFLGGAGLAVACLLILAERAGKAVRSPAKTALLAHAAGAVGLGRGFAVHKALDQGGAVAGPLMVAAIAAVAGTLWPAMAVLIVPGAAALLVLAWLRRKMSDPAVSDNARRASSVSHGTASAACSVALAVGRFLSSEFWLFAAACGVATAGLVTFGVISYHLAGQHTLPVAAVPVIYTAAKAVAALAALVTGWLFDRYGGHVLLSLPILVAVVPALAFTDSAVLAIVGVLIWGGCWSPRFHSQSAGCRSRALQQTHYRLWSFAAVQGAAAIAGGTLAGALYDRSLPVLIATVAVLQLTALVLLMVTLCRRHHG